MMNFFQAQTETIQIDDEHSVVIRVPTFQEAMDLGARARKAGKDDMEQAGFFLFQEAATVLIESWHGIGFNGAPVTSENIQKLPAFVIAPVARRCAELVGQGISDSAKK